MSASGGAQSKARCVLCHTSYTRGERFCLLDGGAVVDEKSASDPLIGRTIDDRYLVRRFIGKGGMGAVYEAEHIGLDRQVAIKFISDAEADRDLRARFRQEARAASRVVDEHVVQIFDVGVAEDGRDYIVMELVTGTDLHAALAKQTFSPARAAGIARQILLGLDAIHAAGIVHRDIKPPNVLLLDREDDFVKIMDFGIAKSMDAQLAQTHTGTGRVVGTVHYMAPEQLSGEAVDPRADLYAVGVTLFVMLTGELPFTGASGTYATATLSQPAPSLAALRSDVPAALVAAVARALEKSPAARFATALEFADALDEVAGGRSRGAPATTPNRPREAAGAPATTPMRARNAPAGDGERAIPTARETAATAVDRGSSPRSARRISWLHVCVCVAALALAALVVLKIRETRSTTTPPPAAVAPPVAAPVVAPAPDRVALARAAEDRGDLTLAIALYEEAFASHSDPALLYRIGDLHERLGDRAKAATYLSRYLEASPAAVDREAVTARIARLADVPDAGVPPSNPRKPTVAKTTPRETGPTCLYCTARGADGSTYYLCAKKLRAPWCKCMGSDAWQPLCSRPWIKTDSDGMPQADGAYDMCIDPSRPGCDKPPYSSDCNQRYNKPAPDGGACRGYAQHGASEETGKYACNWCDNGDFHGHDGEACSGFDKTGAAGTGTLDRCK